MTPISAGAEVEEFREATIDLASWEIWASGQHAPERAQQADVITSRVCSLLRAPMWH